MKCFYHPAVDAVAVCKSCSRGICHECLSEVDKSSSCKNRCEADVATLNDLVQRGRTAYQKTSATFFRSAIFISLMGGGFLLVGIWTVRNSEPNYFLCIMGVLFLGWGISHFISAKRLSQK